MIHEKYPKYFIASPFITRIKAASVAAADHVICISESTRRDLLATYDIPEERVSVTHLGFDPLAPLLTANLERLQGSSTRGRCPVSALCREPSQLQELRDCSMPLRLGIAADKFFFLVSAAATLPARAHRNIQSRIAGRVKYVGGSDVVLTACYAHASLFRLPSFYEGSAYRY